MLPFHALGYDDSIKLFVDWFLNGRVFSETSASRLSSI